MTLLTADLMFNVLLSNWNSATYCLIFWLYCHCQAVSGLTCHDICQCHHGSCNTYWWILTMYCI